MEFESCKLGDNISEIPCVYFLMNDNELCYIGQTVNLKKRIQRHNNSLNDGICLGGKLLVPNSFDSIYYIIMSDKQERRELENKLIDDYLPKWNYEGIHSQISYGCIQPDLRPESCNHR